MSNKLNPETLQTVNFRISDDELERLDRLALRANLTRSQFIRNLVTSGLEECELYEKFGLVRAALTVRDIASWMADKAKSIPEDIDMQPKIKA